MFKIIIFILIHWSLSSSVLATNFCETSFLNMQEIANNSSIFDLRKLLTNKVPSHNTKGNFVFRVFGKRKINNWDDNETIASFTEFPISLITFLHPIPNPYNPKSNWQNVENLKSRIVTYGYQLDQAITIVLMPDGKFRCVSGHHRIRAMIELGEQTVPVTLESYNHSDQLQKDLINELISEYRLLLPQFNGSYEHFMALR